MPIVSKPSGLATILSWMNWNAGDFIKFEVFGIGFGLPPFSFQPGNMIEGAIDLLIWPINRAYDLAFEGLEKAKAAIIDAAKALYQIQSWLLGAVQWFTNQITDWWAATWNPIYNALLTMIGTAGSIASNAWAWIENAGVWIKEYTDPIYSWIGAILVNYVRKVDLADLFKPFQEFMDFWLMVKDEMVDFFNDPWDFLYRKFDDFFERFW